MAEATIAAIPDRAAAAVGRLALWGRCANFIWGRAEAISGQN
jgi:hypothetical protein